LLSSIWTIAKNSFTEIIRQPFFALLLAMGMGLIALSPAVTMFSMVEDEKLMVDMALATIMLLGLVIAVLSVSQTISREIEAQTVGAILSKPVGRVVFVLAKFVGVSMTMFVTMYLLTLVGLITLRIGVPSTASYRMDWPALLALLVPFGGAVGLGMYCNYFYRWNFSSTAVLAAICFYTLGAGALLMVGPDWHFDILPAVFVTRHADQVALAALLVWLGVWVISAIALACSTRLNVLVNAIICVMAFFVGSISQFLFGRFADSSTLAWLAVRVAPNVHFFWVGDRLMQQFPYIPLDYVGVAALYALGYCAAMVALAAFLFQRREVI